jgi:hypothetical protein
MADIFAFRQYFAVSFDPSAVGAYIGPHCGAAVHKAAILV